MPSPFKKDARTVDLSTDVLILSPKLQARVFGVDDDHADDIAEALRLKKKLPRPQVAEIAQDDGSFLYYVYDGFHTVIAHKKRGKKLVACAVRRMTWEQAVVEAAGANRGHHALKRSRKDKERAVLMLLEVHPDWALSRIADQTGVSPQTVLNVRNRRDGKVPAPPPVAPPAAPAPASKLDEPAAELPDAVDWRTVPLAGFLTVPDFVWAALRRDNVKTAGELGTALAAGANFGLKPDTCADLWEEISHLDGFDLHRRPEFEDKGGVKAGKAGQELFNYGSFDQNYGVVARGVDQLARAYPGELNGPDHQACVRILTEFRATWKGWTDRLKKGQKPR